MAVKTIEWKNFILSDMLLLEREQVPIVIDGDAKALRLESDGLEASFPLCESVVRQLACDAVTVHESRFDHRLFRG